MKTLSTLALLTAASAAQAYTLDVQVGHANSNDFENSSIVGFGVGSQLNNEFHLGLNVLSKSLIADLSSPDSFAGVDAKVRTATFDLTYELSSGGIRPFIGAGVGLAWFQGASISSSNVLATKLFAGLAFQISTSVDLVLTAQHSQLYNIHVIPNDAGFNTNNWEALAGLRFKF
jgi:opacity protein-like surface antigen